MAVRSTAFSEEKMFGDLVLHMESQEYCLVSATVTNPAGASTSAYLDPVGQPVKIVTGAWTLVLGADIANVTGVIVQGNKINALAAAGVTNAADPYLILKKAPAIINKDKLSALDNRGVAIDVDAYATALAALGFVVRTEAANTVIQVE
jgi:hypothetical protein